ncbi:hypothetical protein SAMN05216246_103139 [Actinomyces denticolens]|uniref:Uncharacterized protein n=1 Tax=Actinomyces denticolens TaxID=52767 RepID=A0ABY1I519_9ACTO|nr:hypothetical protein [Actinomyces denticolens]SHI61327.1 hypothetical protein SAMN05216246_103139 [Actinomyces denticolens]
MTNHDDNDDELESTRPLTRRERRGLERLGEAQAERRAAAERQAAERRRAAEARAAEQRAEARRRAAEKRAAERRAAELHAEQQRQAAERRAAEEARLRAQRAEAARIEAARAEAERAEAERLAAERIVAQRRAAQEARRREAERAEAERLAAERIAAQRRAAQEPLADDRFPELPAAAPRLPETRFSEAGPVQLRGAPDGSPGGEAAEDASDAAEPPSTTGGQRALGAALNRSRPSGHAALVLVCLAVAAIIILPLALSIVNGKSPASRAVTSPSAAAMLPADTPLDQAMSVSGRVGARPVVKLTAPLSAPSSLIKDTLITGEGRVLEPGDAALLSIATFSGTDGKNTTSPGADSEGSEHAGRRLVSVSVDQASLNDLTDIITGTTEGTRLVLRGPVVVDGTPSTEITVIDVLPTTASGTAVAPPAGMPAVIPGDAGGVTLSLAGLPAPTRSTAVTLIQGTGEQVHSDSRVIARVQAVSWTDGSVITNDYGATALPVSVDLSSAKTYAGLRNHLVDVPVGSRVVLALPADQARGDRPVAVVVDVLAIEDPKTDAPGTDPAATPTVGSDPEISSPAPTSAPTPAAPAATAGN